jgi:hypothetical protein
MPQQDLDAVHLGPDAHQIQWEGPIDEMVDLKATMV